MNKEGSFADVRLRRIHTDDLTAGEIVSIRTLLVAAFSGDEDGFDDADWEHALGGIHFLLEVDGEIVAHAAVVQREIHVGAHGLRTGYVEAVATAPAHQGRGFGTRLMADVTEYVSEGFDLGVLGTGRHHFYVRLGWSTWRGASSVRTAAGLRPTPDDDGFLLVLRTKTSPVLEGSEPISCDWRPGDVW